MAKNNHHPYVDNGDLSEKIRNLKSLNALLLKETAEKRCLLVSLQLCRDELEAEVRRIGSVAHDLKVDLSAALAECFEMELERSVLSCFMESWREEIREVAGKSAVARDEEVRVLSERVGGIWRVLEEERGKAREVVGERDALVVEHRELVDGVRRLGDMLEGVEEARMRLRESLDVVERENGNLRREKVGSERIVEGLGEEIVAVAEELAQVGREVGWLRGRVEELERANVEISRDKKGKEDEIVKLERELAQLKAVAVSIEKEEGKMLSRLFELESLQNVALEKVKEREWEIGASVEENRRKEAEALHLSGARVSLEKKLRMLEEELEGKEHSIEMEEKMRIEMEELVGCNRKEVAGLKGEVSKLKDEITGLEMSCLDHEDKSKALQSEVSSYREALSGVQGGKGELEKCLDEERQNAVLMASKSLEMKRKIEETTEESKAMKGERDVLVMEKAEVASKLSSCIEEKEVLETRLSSAERTIVDLEEKIELSVTKYDQVAFSLKNTVESLVKDNDGSEENFLSEGKLGEDFQLYEIELNAIRTAFRNKDRAIEELTRQLEAFKESAASAEKEKGVWTLVSSAATLIAAASVVYLASGC